MYNRFTKKSVQRAVKIEIVKKKLLNSEWLKRGVVDRVTIG